MAADVWTQIFQGHSSIYSLNENDRRWTEEGQSGTLTLYQHNQNSQNIAMKWQKDTHLPDIWWRLPSSKLKPKGERALVFKAWTVSTNIQQILAVRFISIESKDLFGLKYAELFPDDTKWKCTICNVKNQYSDKRCIQCGIKRTGHSRINIQSIYKHQTMNHILICDVCAFQNPVTQSRCQGCTNNLNSLRRANKKKFVFFTKDNYQMEIAKEIIKTEHIIHGYCRNIETRLLMDRIIPSSVVNLCFAFYINVECIFEMFFMFPLTLFFVLYMKYAESVGYYHLYYYKK